MDSQELELEQVLQRPALLGEQTRHSPSRESASECGLGGGGVGGGILQAREVTAFSHSSTCECFLMFPSRELLMARTLRPVVLTVDIFIKQPN